jgi:hypothetical protein
MEKVASFVIEGKDLQNGDNDARMSTIKETWSAECDVSAETRCIRNVERGSVKDLGHRDEVFLVVQILRSGTDIGERIESLAD